jgi:NSS family neurotransmitter:Na+ symporter
VFFFLLIAAAITSCIGNFAPVVAWTEEKFGLTHAKAALSAGSLMWLLGLGSVFSFNILSEFHPLSFIGGFEGMTIYDSEDFVMSNVLLPVGAFLTAIFIGWRASNDAIREEIGLPDGLAFRTWRVLVRFVVPLAVAIIFIGGVTG